MKSWNDAEDAVSLNRELLARKGRNKLNIINLLLIIENKVCTNNKVMAGGKKY